MIIVIVAVDEISPKSETAFIKRESSRTSCYGGNFKWIYYPCLIVSKFLNACNLQFEYLRLPRNSKIEVHVWF